MDTCGITVLVTDDHALIRRVVCALLSEHFKVIASVSNGDHLIRAAVELRPDVIVSDVEMPDRNGLDAMLELRTLGVHIPVVLMSAGPSDVGLLLASGAAAYVQKCDIFADLIEAVKLAVAGGTLVSRSVVNKELILHRHRNGTRA